MKDHGKMNAKLLQPAYWEKAHLPAAAKFAERFQILDQSPEADRSQAIQQLLTDMAKQGYNNPVNPAWALYSAVLVQRK